MATMTCYCGGMMRICGNCGKVYCARCEYRLSDRVSKEMQCPDCGSRSVRLADESNTRILLKTGRAYL